MGFWAFASTAVSAIGGAISGDGGDPVEWTAYYNDVPQGFACPGSPSEDAIERAIRSMPQDDIDTIISGLSDANNGRAPASREELADRGTMYLWVKAMMGGADCQIDNQTFSWMPQFLKQKVQEYGGNELNPAGVNQAVMGASGESGVVGGLGSIPWRDILEAAGVGAVNEATEALEQATAPQSAQAGTAQQAGGVVQEAGFLGMSGNQALLIGGAAVAAVLILRS